MPHASAPTMWKACSTTTLRRAGRERGYRPEAERATMPSPSGHDAGGAEPLGERRAAGRHRHERQRQGQARQPCFEGRVAGDRTAGTGSRGRRSRTSRRTPRRWAALPLLKRRSREEVERQHGVRAVLLPPRRQRTTRPPLRTRRRLSARPAAVHPFAPLMIPKIRALSPTKESRAPVGSSRRLRVVPGARGRMLHPAGDDRPGRSRGSPARSSPTRTPRAGRRSRSAPATPRHRRSPPRS